MGPLLLERVGVNWRSLDYRLRLRLAPPIPSVVISNFFRNVRMASAVASEASSTPYHQSLSLNPSPRTLACHVTFRNAQHRVLQHRLDDIHFSHMHANNVSSLALHATSAWQILYRLHNSCIVNSGVLRILMKYIVFVYNPYAVKSIHLVL
jgi:hypothetical protein